MISRTTPPIVIAGLLLSVSLAMLTAWDGIANMWGHWKRDEYSYAYFVPLLTAFFIWQRKNILAETELRASWLGIALALFGIAIIAAGELATLFVITQYGFVVTLHGIAFAFLGWKGYRIILVPMALLFFAVPLPGFLYNNLSHNLQLISSEIGVWVIRQFGLSVYLDGNVINLAQMQLQVVEACSGLRYLFPLTAVSFMIAYLYRAPFWKRTIVFLSAIPVTVLMNSFRIGLVGVTVDYWGPEMARGILHDFEGWVIFMSSLGVILLLMLALNLIGKPRQRFNDTFYLELPGPLPEGVQFRPPPITAPLIGVVLLLIASAGLHLALPERTEIIPEREAFTTFPSRVGNWSGRVDRLESIYVDQLKLDDYLLVNYSSPDGGHVNVYSAYYGSQRKGASAHSPQSCLPGGGWHIASFDRMSVEGVEINGQPLHVNRAVIKKRDVTQVVYYWFQQRGRVLTNEYLVKWFLFQDSMLRDRSDGALVRLVTQVTDRDDIVIADARLADMAREIAPLMERYVPN